METATRPEHLSSDDVCDIAGITYRQLDYWSRSGLVETVGPACPGSGGVRRYLRREVRVVAAIAALRDLGARGETLRHVAPMLRAMAVDEWAGLWTIPASGDIEPIYRGAPIDAAYVLDLGRIGLRATV